MPPSFMLSIYNNEAEFIKKYLTDAPGYYYAEDCGFFDDNGYLNVMTRLDDVINTAGHRLSTAQMEEVLLSHPDIVDAAVVPKRHILRGDVPIGFAVISKGKIVDEKILEKECTELIRKNIGK